MVNNTTVQFHYKKHILDIFILIVPCPCPLFTMCELICVIYQTQIWVCVYSIRRL